MLGLPRSKKDGSWRGRPPGTPGRHDKDDCQFFEVWGDLLIDAPDPTWHLTMRTMRRRGTHSGDPRADEKRLKARWKRDGREIYEAYERRERRRQDLRKMINGLDVEDRRWLAGELMDDSLLLP
jgi:hypothetical protein